MTDTHDLFEGWTPAAPLTNLEWAEDDKDLSELLEELKKSRPPMYKGQRVPFAVFHLVGRKTLAQFERDTDGNYVRGPDNLPLRTRKVVRWHRLMTLPLHATHGTRSKIDFYHRKGRALGGKGLVYWWFPKTGGPVLSENGNISLETWQGVQRGSEMNRKYQALKHHCESVRSMDPDHLEETSKMLKDEVSKREALEQKLKEMKAQLDADKSSKKPRRAAESPAS